MLFFPENFLCGLEWLFHGVCVCVTDSCFLDCWLFQSLKVAVPHGKQGNCIYKYPRGADVILMVDLVLSIILPPP